MRNLTIGDLKLALRELLGDLLPELTKSETGKLYEKRLRAKQKIIESIPDAASRQVPLAAELSEADVVHDGHGASLFYLAEAILAHPKLPASLKVAAKEMKETFVPQLGVLRLSYADEAAAALDNRPELTRLKTRLKETAVPGGGTAYEWVRDFLAAGDAIDKLLRERAGALATGENAAATGPLRSSTVGLLGRFRDALRDELEEEGSKLPPDYETKLFAYIDKLSADRTAAGTPPAEPAPGEPVGDAKPPSPPADK